MAGKGRKIKRVIGDISKLADAQRRAGETVAFPGGLDILVNKAGIGSQDAVVDTKDETWDRQIAVNRRGIFRRSKFSVPAVIQAGGELAL